MKASASASETIEIVFSVRRRFEIQTIAKQNAVRYLLKAYNKYRKIQKKNTRSNKNANRCDIIKQFQQSLRQLFDISHSSVCADAKKLHFRKGKPATVPQTATTMKSSSVVEANDDGDFSDEACEDKENDVDFVFPVTKNESRKRTKSDSNVLTALDRTNVSNRDAALIIATTINSHNGIEAVENCAFSPTTIYRARARLTKSARILRASQR